MMEQKIFFSKFILLMLGMLIGIPNLLFSRMIPLKDMSCKKQLVQQTDRLSLRLGENYQEACNFCEPMYDTRVSRWLSVDPEANKYSSLSPYVAFENNPIVIVDRKGDSTLYFYQGKLVHVSHDNLDNAIVVLTFSGKVGKILFDAVLASHIKNGTADSENANRTFRKFGVSYMIDDYKNLLKETRKDKLDPPGNSDYSNEYGFTNYIKNGIVKPGTPEENSLDITTSYGNSGGEGWRGMAFGKGHTHPNAGKAKDFFSTFTHKPSDKDYDTKETTEYDVVISPKYMYFINSSEQDKFAVPMKNTFNKSNAENYDKEVTTPAYDE